MRTASILQIVIALAGCATPREVVHAAHSSQAWDGRDVAELIALIGPEDSVIINREKEVKSFNWFRFGACRLTAFTGTDNKIIRVETDGTVDGCSAYIEKLQRG